MPDRNNSTPAPGIYYGIPAEEYHAWEAASNSALTLLARSPAHCRAALDAPREPTPAMIRGTALHTAVLEPGLFSERYTLAERCAAVLSSGARKGDRCFNDGKKVVSGEWRCGQHDGGGVNEESRQVLSREDFADCRGMARAVDAHPAASALLASASACEASIVFLWPGTDILCKARIDILCEEEGVIGDLKTTTDASPRAFEKSIFAYGYHRQAPFYQAACASQGIQVTDSILAAVEPVAPYGVGVYRLTDGAVDAGAAQLEQLLATWHRCMVTGEWPAYSPNIEDIALPAWAWGQL